MRLLLKCLHQLGVIGFMGALAALGVLVLASGDAATQPPWQTAAAHISRWLVMPCLLLAVVTGLLLMMAHPPFMAARWVWLKALMGTVVGALLLLPGVSPQTVVNVVAIALGVALLAVVLAVWRPRLGQGAD